MFKGKTVIVVGAGASKEVGMPLGGDLTEKIAKAVDLRWDYSDRRTSGDEEIEYALRQYVKQTEGHKDINPHRAACMEIVAGMREAPSIDEFMHTRRGDQRIQICGKLGIVHCILKAEHGSKLHFKIKNISDTIRFEQVQDTWFAQFKRFLTEGCRVDDVSERLMQVTLIVFNYDRCVEHYLLHSLQTYYSIKEKEAAEILQSLEIIHPYGVVGELPWQSTDTTVPFGDSDIFGRLPALAEGIRTFSEQDEDTESQNAIRRTMQESNLILFLGFAFHKQNLDLLSPEVTDRARNVICTAVGISDVDCDVLRMDLGQRFCGGDYNKVDLRKNLSCYQLFDEYWRTFSNI